MTRTVSQARVRTSAQRRWSGLQLAILHLLPMLALIHGTQVVDWIFLALVYPLQALGVGIGLHRYFAHRAFHTSRSFQFLLALCASFTFGNAVAFAGKHRLHHRSADTPDDVHSPVHGVWACWIGNLIDHGHSPEQVLARVPDLRRFPELMWLHRHPVLPGLLLCLLAIAVGGWTTAAIGVCLGAVICLHQSSWVNYFCHVHGSRRFETPDRSTNNWLAALLTFGEGWHNNHHRYPSSARAGFVWWEIDPLYYVICLWERLGLVWDVRRPLVNLENREKEPCRTLASKLDSTT